MAAVLAAMLIALSLWAVSYRTLSSQVVLEERASFINPNATIGRAMATAIACFRVSPPAVPHQCVLTIGQGAAKVRFQTTYTDAGSPKVRLEVSSTVTEGVPDCECSGGAQ